MDTYSLLHNRLRNRLDEFGITRLADTTGLDRIGIPTASAVCPATRDTIWVYSGKGKTTLQAEVSAIMECVERTSALWDQSRVVWASLGEASRRSATLSPTCFTENLMSGNLETLEIGWIEGENVATRTPVLVPAELAFTGRRPTELRSPAFCVSTTNGLGAGFTRESALSHALAELIERDIVSCAALRASHYGAAVLRKLARLIGSDETSIFDKYHDDIDFALSVDRSTIPESVLALYNKFETAGLQVSLKMIPNDFGLPAFGAATIEEMGFDNVLGAAGYGVSPDPEEAACSALLELAQSRATDRQGAREDCGVEGKARLDAVPFSHWLATPSSRLIDFSEIPQQPLSSRLASSTYLKLLDLVGLKTAVVVDFNLYSDIFVVRVIVPEAETWQATQGQSRLGVRMHKKLIPTV